MDSLLDTHKPPCTIQHILFTIAKQSEDILTWGRMYKISIVPQVKGLVLYYRNLEILFSTSKSLQLRISSWLCSVNLFSNKQLHTFTYVTMLMLIKDILVSYEYASYAQVLLGYSMSYLKKPLIQNLFKTRVLKTYSMHDHHHMYGHVPLL